MQLAQSDKHLILSTAAKHCGVVFGRSVSGGVLKPVSWCAMLDESTGLLERRKVAEKSI